MKTMMKLLMLAFACQVMISPIAGHAMNVPMFGQCDYPWGPDPYGYPPSGVSICQKGCAMTCCAMVLRYYGVLKTPSGEDVTPRTLNNWLKANGGYSNRRNVNWGKVAVFSCKAASKNGGKTIKYNNGPERGHDTATLNSDLSAQRPVILNVNSPSGRGHFLVATGPKNFVGYPINDPMKRSSNLTTGYGGIWNSMRRYKPSGAGTSTASDPSALSLCAYPTSIEVLLVDSLGRRTGIDPNSWQQLTEIPDSYYVEEEGIEDDETGEWSPDDSVNVVEALTPLEGNYTLKVFSAAGGIFTVEVSDIDDLGNYYDQTITGILNPGQVLEYPVTHATAIPIITIGDAKVRGSGAFLTLTGKIVSAGSNAASGMYVQEPDRSAGIRMIFDPYDPNLPYVPGDVVDISGYTYLVDSELVFDSPTITRASTGTAPKPEGMPNKSLGGTAFGDQPGITGTYGLNNVGLLVKSWGVVTTVGDDYFYIDDGCALLDGSGSRGVRVAAPGLTKPDVDDYVSVAGISSVTIINENIVRLLRPREQVDILVVHSGGGRGAGAGGIDALRVAGYRAWPSPSAEEALASSSFKAMDSQTGSIGWVLSQPDGAVVDLQGQWITDQRLGGAVLALKEPFEPYLQQPRLVLNLEKEVPELVPWLQIDVVGGTLITMSGGQRAVTRPSAIYIRVDPNGHPILMMPKLSGVDGLFEPWPWRKLTYPR